jgi:Domain of unknown function (DUF4440)
MKQFIGVRSAVLLAAMCLLASGSPAFAAKISRDQAVQLQRKYLDLIVAGDWKGASEMMAPEMLWIHATARIDTKQSRMDSLIKGPARPWSSIETKDDMVDVFNDFAIVTSDTTWASPPAPGQTGPRVAHLRLTTVWVNQGGTWRLVRFQGTMFPPPAAT